MRPLTARFLELAMNVPSRRTLTRCALLASITLLSSPLRASFITSGNFSPTNPAGWTSSTTAKIGDTSTGSVTINADSDLNSGYAYLGNSATGNGIVTVTGTGSTWTNSTLFCGNSGTGALNINSAATVSSTAGVIGYNTGSTGTVFVDGSGSNWTASASIAVGNSGRGTLNISNSASVTTASFTIGAQGIVNFGTGGGALNVDSLVWNPSQFSGTGTINAKGFIGDASYTFNSTSSLSQTLHPVPAITLNLTLGSMLSSAKDLGIGLTTAGSLAISNGIILASNAAYLGSYSGSTGSATATVTGAGSAWLTNSFSVGSTSSLEVDNNGTLTGDATINGTLRIP